MNDLRRCPGGPAAGSVHQRKAPGRGATSGGRRRAAVLAAALALVAPAALAAQVATAVTVRHENDILALWRARANRSDRDYSSGASLTVTRRLGAGAGGLERLVTGQLAHAIYTPNLTAPDPAPLDRPYAAVLSATAGLEWQSARRRDALTATLAVTGPPALGEPVQRFFHKLTNSPLPVGWDAELPFEVGVGLGFAGARGATLAGTGASGAVRAAVEWGADIGTLYTGAHGGVRIVAGLRPPPAWLPALPAGERARPTRAYLHGGARLDAVARAWSLDGPTFATRPRIPRRWLVPRAELGVGLEVAGITGLLTAHVTGREFDRQPRDMHVYGSVAIVLR